MNAPVDQRDIIHSAHSVHETPAAHAHIDFVMPRSVWMTRHPQPVPRRAPAPWPFIVRWTLMLCAVGYLALAWPFIFGLIARVLR